MKSAAMGLSFLALAVCAAGNAQAAVAFTYQFNNSFAADQSTTATLNSVGGPGNFQSATVLGQTRTVWNFNGTDGGGPASQVGLQLNTNGEISNSTYSLELVFELTTTTGYRRVMDLTGLSSDNGVYVRDDNLVNYPTDAGATGVFTAGTFYEAVLTTDGVNYAGYVDGALQFSNVGGAFVIPGSNLVSFFLDNLGAVNNEYSSGDVALVQYFDNVLSADDVSRLFAEDLPSQNGDTTAAPEPQDDCKVGVV